MGRLTIDVTDQQHQALKALAALEGKTIKQYALERLLPGDLMEGEQAMAQLKGLLAERLAAATRGEVSSRSAVDIAEEEIRPMGAGPC